MTTSKFFGGARGFAIADLRRRAFVLLAFLCMYWAQPAWAQDIRGGGDDVQPGPEIGVPDIPVPGPDRVPVSTLSGTVFLDLQNEPSSARAVTVFGGTGQVRGYR